MPLVRLEDNTTHPIPQKKKPVFNAPKENMALVERLALTALQALAVCRAPKNESECKPCSVGKYSIGGMKCTECPSGLVSDKGASSQNNCFVPSPTSFPTASVTSSKTATLTASVSPTPSSCAGGCSRSDEGFGKYDDCSLCPAGTYSRDGKECMACPPGTSSKEGSIEKHSCFECPRGKFGPGGSKCLNCPEGTGSREGTESRSECIACPIGSHSRGGIECKVFLERVQFPKRTVKISG